MDEIVLRGMARWPDVPAVYGWLTLDRRGNWLLKGEPVSNPALIALIGRNYACDERGRWYFQNGPQRVFVELECAPFVYRVSTAGDDALAIEAHDGRAAQSLHGAWIDENGTLLLGTELGAGVVHDGDLARLLAAFEDEDGRALDDEALERRLEGMRGGRGAPLRLRVGNRAVRVEPIASSEAPARLGYVPRPAPAAGEEACR